MTDARDHWQTVYKTKDVKGVSWYREHLEVSIALLKQAGLNPHSRVIDIGAGASTLVDDLLNLGVQSISALDISEESLSVAKRRLGSRGERVQWLVGDAAKYPFAESAYDIWHDRAALHFLTDKGDQRAYVENAMKAIAKGGNAVIGTFAPDGPEKCSGLPVMRRSAEEVAQLFGPAFSLVDSRSESHITPNGSMQSFAYALLKKK